MAEAKASYAKAHAGFRLEDVEAALSGSSRRRPQRLRRVLRPLGGGRSRRPRMGGPARQTRPVHLRRPQGQGRQFRQRSQGSRRRPRRRRRLHAAARPRSPGRRARDLAGGRRLPAALHRLRPEGDRAAAQNLGREARRDRPRQPAEARRSPKRAAGRRHDADLGRVPQAPGDIDFAKALAAASPAFEPVMRKGDDLFLLMSTSGTTGLPKGVPVPLKALIAFHIYMTYAIDLRPEDKFWNIADPGWAYGLYYAVTGPLLLGHATTFYDGPFTVESTYRMIKDHGITNLAGAPTAYRLLIAAGPEAAAGAKGQLRAASSAGEPLNPEVIRWFAEHLSAPIHDHYGQTENGMMVNNHHGLDHAVRVGSAGFAMPGYRVAVLDEEGRELGPGVPGTLAVDIAKSPARWFDGLSQPGDPGHRRRLLPHRRHGRTRGERPHQLRRPQRRRHHVLRLPDRSVRRRKRADRAQSDPRDGGDRQARSGAHGNRQGVRRPEARLTKRATSLPRNCASMSASGSPRTPIRARSPSSSFCPRRRAARSSVSFCATPKRRLPCPPRRRRINLSRDSGGLRS